MEIPNRYFLDIPKCAELAGISVRHMRRKIEEDGVRIVQIGRRYLVTVNDFKQWWEKRQVKK